MSNTPTPPGAAGGSRRPSRNRSQALGASIARAEIVAAALPRLLPGIAKADADAAKVRIDAEWVANLKGVIAAAKAARGNRATRRAAQKTATQTEHQIAGALATLLKKIRVLVKTHNPSDRGAQTAYGLGADIASKRVSELPAIADGFVAAYGGEWTKPAADAGVTQAMIDQVSSLAASLTAAAGQQKTLVASGTQQTMSRKAAQGALVKLCAFAVTVVKDVFGAGSPALATLTDPRPLQGRGAARKTATKAKVQAKKARVAAKKAASRAKPGARSKSRARRAVESVVATRVAALVTGAGAGKKSSAKKTTAAGAKTKAKANKT